MENFIRIVTSAPDADFQRVLQEELGVLRSSLSSQTTLHGSVHTSEDVSTVEQNENANPFSF